jgi:protein-S-isoprenylcysteine O-methyltransferase Ste14
MIDRIRYVLAVVSVITLPPGLLFWFVIHPWAGWWRRLGPVRTYLIVLPLVVAFGVLLFHLRARLLGADLGVNWGLIAIGAVLYGVSTLIAFQHWRHLSIATMIGIPELSPTGQRRGKLLKDGIYRVVRHPRYLSAGLAVIAVALFVDYMGVYLLILFLFPLGYPMLR